MAKNEDIEEILLSSTSSIDELIRQKIDSEISKEIEKAKLPPILNNVIDFKKIPYGLIFSKLATYIVFNRLTKQESFINGIQAESLIGMQSSIREKLIKKLTDCFLTDNYYVKFHSATTTDADEDKGI